MDTKLLTTEDNDIRIAADILRGAIINTLFR